MKLSEHCLKEGSNPLSNQKLSISPEGKSCTFYLVNCPVFPCVWSKVWFCKWDSDGFQICFGGSPFPWGSKFHILLQFAESPPPPPDWHFVLLHTAHRPLHTTHDRHELLQAGAVFACYLPALVSWPIVTWTAFQRLTVGLSGNLVTIALSQTTGEKPFVLLWQLSFHVHSNT